MKKISTSQAPAAIGPYSQAVCLGRAVFTSGQIPVVPETGVVPEGIEAQAHQSCKNVAAILAAAGTSMEKVVKTTCYLADMADFAVFNAVYETYFTRSPHAPAWRCALSPRVCCVKSRQSQSLTRKGTPLLQL